MIDTWKRWISAFDQAAASGQWQGLRDFLSDDVTYTVSGVPFACHLDGPDAVLSGFARSIANFDNHFDERRWYGVGIREFMPGVVQGRAMGVYILGDLPPLFFSASSSWHFKDGKLFAMHDLYDTAEQDVLDALAWLEAHAPELDPSYA